MQGRDVWVIIFPVKADDTGNKITERVIKRAN